MPRANSQKVCVRPRRRCGSRRSDRRKAMPSAIEGVPRMHAVARQRRSGSVRRHCTVTTIRPVVRAQDRPSSVADAGRAMADNAVLAQRNATASITRLVERFPIVWRFIILPGPYSGHARRLRPIRWPPPAAWAWRSPPAAALRAASRRDRWAPTYLSRTQQH